MAFLQIWETADRDNLGYLTPETFSVALKLIACAQHGCEVLEPILSTGKRKKERKKLYVVIEIVTQCHLSCTFATVRGVQSRRNWGES